MAAAALDPVLNHPALWRGNECARGAPPGVPTGFAELDVVLPGGGWPPGALTEIYVERPGLGELRVFMPAAARLTQSDRWITLVAPPYVPYAPALAAHGVKLDRIMLVRTPAREDRLWSCEQALRAGCCGAVLIWLDHVHERSLRRLQLAAESGGTVALLFRSANTMSATPAALKLHVSRSQNRTIVRVLKRRGGGLPSPVALDLHGSLWDRSRSLQPVAPERERMPAVPA
jgi:hypothetical protein